MASASLFTFSLVMTLVLLVSRVKGLQCSSNTTNAVNEYTPEPSSLDDGTHSLVTVNAEEARVAALCHVTCINYLLRSLNCENIFTDSPMTSPSPSPSPGPGMGGEEPNEEPVMLMSVCQHFVST